MTRHADNDPATATANRRRRTVAAVSAGVAVAAILTACGSDPHRVASGTQTPTTNSAATETSNHNVPCATDVDPSTVPTEYTGPTAPLPSHLPQPGPGDIQDFTPSGQDLDSALDVVSNASDLRFLQTDGSRIKPIHQVRWITSRGKELGVILEYEASPPVAVPTHYGTIATHRESSEPMLDSDGMPEVRAPVTTQLVDYQAARIVTVYVSISDKRIYAVDASSFDPDDPCG